MDPAVNEAPPLAYEAITPHHYLFDVVYNPEKSLFLQKIFEARGFELEATRYILRGELILAFRKEGSNKVSKYA